MDEVRSRDRISAGCAGCAEAGNLNVVRLGLETMARGSGTNEAFNVRAGDSEAAPAITAGEVVVVVEAVGELDEAVVTDYNVLDNAQPPEQGQGAVEAGPVAQRKVVANELGGGDRTLLVQVGEYSQS